MKHPVFVVGAPRSGTTMLRVVLDRHPQIAMWPGESAFFRRVYDRRETFGDPSDLRNREHIVNAYLAIEPMHRLKIDLSTLKERMLAEGSTWPALFGSMIRHYATIQGKLYGGEKTPAHVHRIDTLRAWFPGCAIIHIVRDPRDVVSSLVRMPWSNRSVLFAARTWKNSNIAGQAASGADDYLLVKYEELAANPELALNKICRHLGVAYDSLLLKPKEGVPVARPAIARANKPISSDRIGLWREAFQPWQIAAIEATAGPLIQQYGYTPAGLSATALDLAKARAEEIVEVGLQVASRVPCAFFRYLQPANLEAEERWIARAGEMYWSLRPKPKS
ncbi:MAG: sulfotransferase [Acidobacteria bacterium]|nr:sulfotransferase [Acidobacteriota bacterium]